MKWTPQAVLMYVFHCPSEDKKFQDQEMCVERCGGESEVAVEQSTASLIAQENEPVKTSGCKMLASDRQLGQ